MQLPNFLIIGSPKAGTTTLYEALATHPDVFMSAQKEPGFFIHEGTTVDPRNPAMRGKVTNFETYRDLFAAASGYAAVGEATVGYYSRPRAIPKIIARLGEGTKLICILRHPVERAYSHYLYAKLKGFEASDLTFEEAVRDEAVVMEGGWVRRRDYVSLGHYGRHLAPWIEAFGRKNLHIDFFEALLEDETSFFERAFSFLGVDAAHRPPPAAATAKSGVPRNRWLHEMLFGRSRVRSWLKGSLPPALVEGLRGPLASVRQQVSDRNLVKPPLSPSLRASLAPVFAEDVRQVEEWTGRDLSAWLR